MRAAKKIVWKEGACGETFQQSKVTLREREKQSQELRILTLLNVKKHFDCAFFNFSLDHHLFETKRGI